MTPYRRIRADFDRDSIVVYQAYRKEIAQPAVRAGRFVEPFSWNRMTWIKPSFLWLMERSGWAKKSGQECILAIRIKRSGWEHALSIASLTSYAAGIHPSREVWRKKFEESKVHVQWDPERTLRGKKLEHRSIQVGLSRHVIREFTDDWIVSITDVTTRAKKIRSLCLSGNQRRARDLLPREKEYPASTDLFGHLGITR